MTPSSRRSSRIGLQFGRHLANHAAAQNLGEAHGAEGGFVLFPGRSIVRVPDAAFVRTERLTELDEDGFLHMAPDLVVEVISPSDRLVDVLDKVELWHAAGVRLIWLVDPQARTVTVFRPQQPPEELDAAAALDGGEVLPGFRLDLRQIFGS